MALGYWSYWSRFMPEAEALLRDPAALQQRGVRCRKWWDDVNCPSAVAAHITGLVRGDEQAGRNV